MTHPTKLYSAEQIKRIDQIAIREQFQNDAYALMSKAGASAFNKVQELFPNLKKFVIFCGQGNNGGDGFVVGSLAVRNNIDVTIVFLGDLEKLTDESKKAYESYHGFLNQEHCHLLELSSQKQQVTNVSDITNYLVTQASCNLANKMTDAVVIDALFGTGLSKAPEGLYKAAIELINNQANIFAIDIPSGLQANTGICYPACVNADATLTFIGLKQGLLTKSGPDCCGNLFFDDLGIDNKIITQVECSSILLDDAWAKMILNTNLPKRKKDSYKHQFGHVLAIGGDNSMLGAITMAGMAALRTGAGLVTLITRKSHSTEITQYHPELMVMGLDDHVQNHQKEMMALFCKASVVIIGPGFGLGQWSQEVFELVMVGLAKHQESLRAIVIDADGLSLLAKNFENTEFQRNFFQFAQKVIITPHIGEAKKLLKNIGTFSEDLLENRFETVKILADLYHSIVILKGTGSLVYQSQSQFSLCAYGNPGMATAGMGDILTGIIAGLCAQGMEPYEASCLAVYLHAKAGDIQAHEYGERGLIATDILLEIRKLLNH